MKKIIITGNVGKDPEIRADQTGNSFATFSVGISVGTKQTPKTDWVEISCNGKLSEIARNYIKKGTKILVEGFPSVNAYINRENQPVATLRIYANVIELLSKREEGGSPDNAYPGDTNYEPVYNLPEQKNNNKNQPPASALHEDDIPF